MRVTVETVGSQAEALKRLAEVSRRSVLTPRVIQIARTITSDCANRNDECELEAIFNAVKYGDARVEALARGLRYVADPRIADLYSTPDRMLDQCEQGACASDCDEHAALIAALAGAVGFTTALRAWGPAAGDELTHVYAIAGLPKNKPQRWVGLDTTVKNSYVGWEPPKGRVLNALVA